jgi:ferritin
MLNPTVQDAMNRQVNLEFYSSFLYLAMAAKLVSAGYKGMANWLRVSADEERLHAMKLYDYILERGGIVSLSQIEKPPVVDPKPLSVFEATFKHEQFITKSINDLLSLAYAEKDHATASFLQWYVNEQVEEESKTSDVVDQLRLVGDAGSALFLIDRDLATRVPTTPPAASAPVP